MQAATVAVEFTKNNVKSVAKVGLGVLDVATLGGVSAVQKQIATFQNTKGSFIEKADAAEKVSTLKERLHVVTLGFSDAPDKVEHLKQLTGATQIQQAGTHFGEAVAEGDPEKALQATGELLGGAGQIASTALLVAAPAAKVGLIPSPGAATAAAPVTQETAQATTVAESAAAPGVEAGTVETIKGAAPTTAETTSEAEAAAPELGGNSGPVNVKAPPNATPEELAQISQYCARCNEAIESGQLSPTGRVSTQGTLRRQASQAAAAERARAVAAGQPYQGHVGHVPDTTWTGEAEPPAWQDLSPRVNTSLGGQAAQYPVGYKPTEFVPPPDQ